MKTKQLFGILLFLCSIGFVSCGDDDDNKNPEGSVTLNMMNEGNGKTLLGKSDVYINNSNNFKTSTCYIADMGEASGLGTPVKPSLDNLANEMAVVPGHLYHIYDRNVLLDFPSGKRAVMIESGYYKAYVISPITVDGTTTGATLKFVLAYPETNGLPEYETVMGNVDDVGDEIEYTLPKDAELRFSDYLDSDSNSFDIQFVNGKLKVELLESINHISGPYGDYGIFVRSGDAYTYVMFKAGLKK